MAAIRAIFDTKIVSAGVGDNRARRGSLLRLLRLAALASRRACPGPADVSLTPQHPSTEIQEIAEEHSRRPWAHRRL